MERDKLKEILIACIRVRHSAAILSLGGDKAMQKTVANMLKTADAAEQVAKLRAGRYMADNITKEVQAQMFKELTDCRDLLMTVLNEKEKTDDPAVN